MMKNMKKDGTKKGEMLQLESILFEGRLFCLLFFKYLINILRDYTGNKLEIKA